MPRLFIGNVAYQAHERDVERFFQGFHPRSVVLKNTFGFVDIPDPRDAEVAVRDLNGRQLMGKRVMIDFVRGCGRRGLGGVPVEADRRNGRAVGPGGGDYSGRAPWVAKYGPSEETKYRVIVENLSSRVSWQNLKDFMRKAAEVTFVDIRSKTRGEGVACFASKTDMHRAINMLDGAELEGKCIKIFEDDDYGGRNGRRSRSRSPRRRRHSRRRSSQTQSRSRSRSSSRE